MAVPFDVIVDIIEKHFPPQCAYGWDNSGVQLKLSEEVAGVAIALDLTPGVIDFAERNGCDFILTHHPVLFNAVKKLSVSDPVTMSVIKAVKAGISIYSAHTSCDCAPDGLNFELARTLGMNNLEIFTEDGCAYQGGGLGVKGTIPEMSEAELVAHVKKSLGISSLRCSTAKGRFNKIAVIGGAAGEFYAEAAAQGINALVTGEVHHNEFVEAAAKGVLLIEAGHYETEKIFSSLAEKKIKESLNARGFSLSVITAGEEASVTSLVK